jgi:hypothetical protein
LSLIEYVAIALAAALGVATACELALTGTGRQEGE